MTIKLNGSTVWQDRLIEYNDGAILAVTENARTTSKNLENPCPAGRSMICKRPGSPAVEYALVQAGVLLRAVAKAAPRI